MVQPSAYLRNQRGYTMLEVLIAFALLSMIALAILPAMLSLSDALKVQSFRAQCTAIVRAKLQEYVNGVAASGTIGVGPTANTDYVPSGFEYTKQRFYDNATDDCQVEPIAGHPGFRERINTNKIVADTAAAYDDPLITDVPDRLRGFQLFVNIRHYNPRVNAGAQPARQCPSGGTTTTPFDYQFFRLGDALEVVVTGMIRVTPTVAQGGRGGVKWGPLDDVDASTPNPRLVCSSAQIISPPRLPFRYYLGVDGKLRNYQATLAFSAGDPSSSLEVMESHFRNLWSQVIDSTSTISSPVLANIRAISISPENNSAYVLRPGELKQYRNCTDSSVTMTKLAGGTVTFEKVPNCTRTASDVYTWRIDSNIENITVDFKDLTGGSHLGDDQVYGFFNSGGNSTGAVRKLTLNGGSNPGDLAVASASATFTVPTNRPRIRGIFLAPTFPAVTTPSLFYFDNTCPQGASSGVGEFTHCVSLFNSADTNMNRPVREMPTQVEGISF